MNTRELARRIAVVGNVLVTASLFFVLIWWRISLYLFVAGWAVFGVAWLLVGAVRPTLPATVRE